MEECADLATYEQQEVNWDDEVDVVCTGSGIGGVAAALAAVDAGLSVFVADGCGDLRRDRPAGVEAWSRTDSLDRRLGGDELDRDTAAYFDAVSQDLGPLSRFASDLEVPFRVVDDPAPSDLGRGDREPVAPFVGARLRDWGARCLASPYGVFYSRVANRKTTRTRSAAGEAVEVGDVGALDAGGSLSGPALADWLFTQAYDRGIEISTRSPLERLVLEGGRVSGAVIATPTGSRALRARRGVAVATGGPVTDPAPSALSFAGSPRVRVCVVGQTGSRFARVELLTPERLTGQSLVERPRIRYALHP
jgi:choline dehydrogenase-like flavoprotein